MSSLSRLVVIFVLVIGAFSLLHGYRNLGWFTDQTRHELTVGHLPVT
jgi:hypothetical protein